MQYQASSIRPPVWLQDGPLPSVLPEQNVGDEGQQASGEHADDALVAPDGALQRVDALLHGVGVDVVVDGDADAPDRPHGVHHRLHGGGHHPTAVPPPQRGATACSSHPEGHEQEGGDTRELSNHSKDPLSNADHCLVDDGFHYRELFNFRL